MCGSLLPASENEYNVEIRTGRERELCWVGMSAGGGLAYLVLTLFLNFGDYYTGIHFITLV